MTQTLPKRDIPALVEALRIRALALTGEAWERTATKEMMKEAADRLEESDAARQQAEQRVTELQEVINALKVE